MKKGNELLKKVDESGEIENVVQLDISSLLKEDKEELSFNELKTIITQTLKEGESALVSKDFSTAIPTFNDALKYAVDLTQHNKDLGYAAQVKSLQKIAESYLRFEGSAQAALFWNVDPSETDVNILKKQKETIETFLTRDIYITAAKCFNAALAIFQKKLLNNAVELVEESSYIFKKVSQADRNKYEDMLFLKCAEVEILFLEKHCNKKSNKEAMENSKKNNKEARESLRKFRETLETKIKSLPNNQKGIECHADITNKMIGLFTGIVKEAANYFGLKDNEYAILGLGSMSRAEMCPYSDVEYLVLTNSPQKKYLFKKFAQFVELKIINLGETEFFPYHKPYFLKNKRPQQLKIYECISSIENSPTPYGFSVDPAGLNPEGRAGMFDLILTPQELVNLNKDKTFFEEHEQLANAIKTCHFIAGNKQLEMEYEKLITEHLEAPSIEPKLNWGQHYALKILGPVIKKYQPRLNNKEEDPFFEPKRELYRPVNMLIDCLSLFYGVRSQTATQRLEELRSKKFINEETAKTLLDILDKVGCLRIKIQLFYKNKLGEAYHKIFSRSPLTLTKEELTRVYTLTDKDVEDIKYIYRVLFPLMEAATLFHASASYAEKNLTFGAPLVKRRFVKINNDNKLEDVVKRTDLVDYELGMLGFTAFISGNPKEALTHYNKALAIDPLDQNAMIIRAFALSETGNHKQAVEELTRVLELISTKAIEVSDEIKENLKIMLAYNQYFLDKDYAKLTKEFDAMVKSNANHKETIHFFQMDILGQRKEWDEALKFSKIILKDNPKSMAGLIEYAEILLAKNEDNQALSCVKKAFEYYYNGEAQEHSPECYVEACLLAAKILFKNKAYEEALNYLEDGLLTRTKNTIKLLILKKEVLTKLDRPLALMSDLKNFRIIEDVDYYVYTLLTELLILKKDTKNIKNVSDIIISKYPSIQESIIKNGMKNFKRIAHLYRAVSHFAAHNDLSMIKDFKSALEGLEINYAEELATDMENTDDLFACGRLKSMSLIFDKMVMDEKYIHEITSILDTIIQHKYNLIKSIVKPSIKEDVESALYDIKVKTIQEKFIEFHYLRSECRKQAGQLALALEDCNFYEKYCPDEFKIKVLKSELLVKTNKKEDSIPYIEQCKRLQPNNAVIFLFSSQNYYNLRRYRESEQDARRCLALDTNNRQARDIIEYCERQQNPCSIQ